MASPTVDGHANATGSGTSANVTLTTTLTDDIIVLCSTAELNGAGAPATITSVSLSAPITAAESNSGSWTRASSVTWSQVVSGSNTIVIAAIYIFTGTAETVTGVTCGGVAMTKLDSITAALESNDQDMEIWYLTGVAAGTQSIVASLSATVSFVQAQSISVADIDQTTPIDSHAIGQSLASVSSYTQNTTVVGANSFLAGFVWSRVAPTITAGTGTTLLQATAESQASGYDPNLVGSGSHGLTWNLSTAGTIPGAATISLKPSSTLAFSGATFAQRAITSQSGPSAFPWALEIWWMHAPLALSSQPIAVQYSAANDRIALVAFGVNGCGNLSAPWDANGSLPKIVQARGTLTATGISTSSPADLLIAVVGDCLGAGSGGGQTSPPSGFTLIDSAIVTSSFGAEIGAASESVTAVQSGVTVTWGASIISLSSANNTGFIVDALAAAGVTAGAHDYAVCVIS